MYNYSWRYLVSFILLIVVNPDSNKVLEHKYCNSIHRDRFSSGPYVITMVQQLVNEPTLQEMDKFIQQISWGNRRLLSVVLLWKQYKGPGRNSFASICETKGPHLTQ